MGNRANRKLAVERLKAWGFKGRPWTGRLSWGDKNYAAKTVLETIRYSVGDLVHDCDGFNHVIVGFPAEPITWPPTVMDTSQTGALLFMMGTHPRGFRIPPWGRSQLLFEDGNLSCGCPGGVMPPETRESIERYFTLSDEQIAMQKKDGWWSRVAQARTDALRSGHHICDENGICLPEFRRENFNEDE